MIYDFTHSLSDGNKVVNVVWKNVELFARITKENEKADMSGVWTHARRLEPKSSALDHSAIMPWCQCRKTLVYKSNSIKPNLILLDLISFDLSATPHPFYIKHEIVIS